ncbi:phosphotransferase [Paenibacillus sp. SC116]|uniref:phosphotransferase family protein n=1 Tax=Paenibacillus sp. SC116 TaxID=2968986 RepID=UPI00215B1801|nr:aminoglycoside phosphotransferase family protein [Paenibacillus sp. SC116]MCR8845899.1 phosphotransferase [Paenibacillus sp. SC116]
MLKLYHGSMPKSVIVEEYRVSEAVSAAGVLTPKPLEIVEVGPQLGIVFQKVEGNTLLHLLASKPWLVGTWTKKFADLHVSMHQQAAPTALRQQKDSLSQSIANAAQLSMREKEKLLAYLATLPVEDRLCHGDFHPDNVLVGTDAWIIDWMTGMAGSPAADTARTVLLLRFGTLPDGMSVAVRIVVQILRRVMLHIYLKQYCLRSRMKREDIERWMLPIAAARLTDSIPETEKQELLQFVRKRLSD